MLHVHSQRFEIYFPNIDRLNKYSKMPKLITCIYMSYIEHMVRCWRAFCHASLWKSGGVVSSVPSGRMKQLICEVRFE